MNPSLTARTMAILVLVAKLRFGTQDEIRKFLFAGSAYTLASQRVLTGRSLQRLQAANLVEVLPRAVGGPGGGSASAVYAITMAGLRLAAGLDPSLRGGRVAHGPFLMRHSLAVADVVLAFHESAVEHRHELTSWEVGWQLVLKLGAGHIVPDAHVVYTTPAVELEALLEVDLGTEGSRFFAGKIGRYLALWRSRTWRSVVSDWPVVLVIAPTEQRVRLLKQATETVLRTQSDRAQVMAGTEFAFVAMPELTTLGPLADIWHVAGRTQITGLLTPVQRE